ncbi:hypothetical protein [Mogibacterium diversum]|uniref:hypothetical protein n=1 Tax=Mogibacterium diversum TaxID=114527 RepID=UPI0026F36793|nr:hypothetical protein [Mogibacterium diversum]
MKDGIEIKASYRLNEYEMKKIDSLMESGRDSESPNIFTIYVEGIDDIDFFNRWLRVSKLESSHRKLSIKILGIRSDESIVAPGLGNCQKIRLAAEEYKDDMRKIYVSDKDLMTDSNVREYEHLDSLFFTDFPAVESYGFLNEILCKLNEDRYGGKLKSLENCGEFLSRYLRGIYFYRCALHNQEKPEDMNSKAIELHKKLTSYVNGNRDNLSIDGFIEFADGFIPDEVVNAMKSVDDDNVDPRAYIYGHDVGSAIKGVIACYEKELSSKYPACRKTHIEQYVRDNYISEGFYKNDNLFKLLCMRIEYIYKLTMK